MCLKVSPGKAYVRGYDVEAANTTIIDVAKPRDKESIDSALVPFTLGGLVKVNRVFGTPKIDINTSTNIVSLRNQREMLLRLMLVMVQKLAEALEHIPSK